MIADAEVEFLSLEDLVEIKDENEASAIFSFSPRKSLERRVGQERKTGTALHKYTKKIDMALLKVKLEKLADYCFRESSYQLRVLGDYVVNAADSDYIGINVDMVATGVSKGKVEFCFGKGFDNKLGAAALFIQELARYIGADSGFTSEHIIKLAYLKTPDNYMRRDGQYKVSFEFDPVKTTVSFTRDGSDKKTVQREYLDQDAFRFTLGKYSSDYSNIVFERYFKKPKRKIVGPLPQRILGPDLVFDDVFRTPGCLENYIETDAVLLN